MRNRRATWGREAVYGVLFILALIGYGVLRYPAVWREGGAAGVVVPVVLLALYGLAGLRVRRLSEGPACTALQQGAKMGLWLGVVMVAHLTAEYFANMAAPWNAVVSIGLFPVLFAGFGYAGFCGARRTGQWRLGVLASVWSAMLAIVLTCACGFVVNYLFMSRLETILHDSPEFARSGMHDLKAFTVWNSLDACASHLVIAPVFAALFGSVGSLMGKGWAGRRAKVEEQEQSNTALQRTEQDTSQSMASQRSLPLHLRYALR